MSLENQLHVSKIIFAICLAIVLLSFTSLIFPAFLVESVLFEPILDKSNREINIYEPGVWATAIVIVNVIFFGLLVVHKLNKLPKNISKLITKITTNDISKKTCVIILLVLFILYFIFSFDEFQREEFELGDYSGVGPAAENFEFAVDSIISPQLRYFFLHTSLVLFDNIRIIPFIASISLLLITFFLTLELTKKRIAGVVAFGVLLQSNLFLLFDTTSAYENFWTAFYFFSLYLIFKKPIGSHASFVLGMLTKPLMITLLPINLFAILTSDIKKTKKIILWVSYGAIILLIVFAFLSNNITHVASDTSQIDFDYKKLVSGMNEFGNSLRFEGLIIILFIPTIIILFRKKGPIVKSINIILLGIVFSILSQPIMFAMIDITIQPYRFIPIIVFSAISIGMIFSTSNISDQK